MSTSCHKVVFIGEPGAGKTTCIAALSDIAPVTTDVECTDELALRKARTTVALDYGELALDDRARLLLYGLPGQERFRYMFEVVREGLVGAVCLVDASTDEGIAGLETTLSTYRTELAALPFVVVLNKEPTPRRALREGCLAALRRSDLVAPIVVADARSREAIARVFDLLFLLVANGGTGENSGDDAWA